MPGLETYFNLYATGPSVASGIISDELVGSESGEILEIQLNRISLVLGYWLHNYIMPFPGVILDDATAAAYLNLDANSFVDNQSYFEVAKYSGPFGSSTRRWWRYKLDQLLDDNDYDDGLAYLVANGIEADCSRSAISNNEGATFVCLLTGKPILWDESTGELSWIPDGADLARVSNRDYRAIAPLMGL